MRDYKVRYAQTWLGYWWSIVQPLASLAVLYLVFSKMIKVNTGEVSYFSFALSGLVLWNYFYYVVTQSAASLLNAQAMIKKIYFPRLALPFSRTLAGLIEPLIGVCILGLFMLIYKEGGPFGFIAFSGLLILTMVGALGIGLWAAALSIRYRDIQQILPISLQFLFFLSPVAYGSGLFQDLIPQGMEWLLYLNPMTGIIDLFRGLNFGLAISSNAWISVSVAMVMFCTGLLFFRSVERKMADLI